MFYFIFVLSYVVECDLIIFTIILCANFSQVHPHLLTSFNFILPPPFFFFNNSVLLPIYSRAWGCPLECT